MDKKNANNSWGEEFIEFLNTSPVDPPKISSEKIMKQIQLDLTPSKWIVFAKLSAYQAVCSILTLFICPQFHLGFSSNHAVIHFLESAIGKTGCMVVCGAIFMSGGAMLAALCLKREEIQIIRRAQPFYYLIFALSSLGIFIYFGAQAYITIAVSWLAGAILGGYLSFEIIKHLRFNRKQQN